MDKINENKNRILGLDILRIWMCFEVIICHFWFNSRTFILTRIFDVSRLLAVPVFFIISFYFMEKNITDGFNEESRNKFLKKRLVRLFFPQLIWAIIYFMCFKLIDICTNSERILSFKDLVAQIFTGSVYELNMSMWFQADLILVLIFLICLRLITDKNWIKCLWGILIFCLALHYTGVNYAVFRDAPFHIKYSIGRLTEVLPFSIIGILFSYYNINEIVLKKKKNIRIIGGLSFVIWVIFVAYVDDKYNVLIEEIIPSMSYAGIYLILGAAILFLSFATINSDNSKLDPLSYMAKCTFGVYCCHRLIWNIFRNILWDRMGDKIYYNFIYCLIIFTVSMIISVLISKINNKWVKALVQ